MGQAVNHIKGYITLVLMYIGIGIVNGYQLLCGAHTVLEPHSGTAALLSCDSPTGHLSVNKHPWHHSA